MLGAGGEVKLVDFGIARARGSLHRSISGTLQGKFAYMSPEQVQGLPVDARSDLFSLGVVLHEFTVGQRLFREDSDIATIAAIASADVPPPSTLVADYLPDDAGVWFHSENGLLGMGPFPFEGDEDPQRINAGKQTVTVVPGGSTFDSATSFAMIRGGHVNLAILGAMQVAMNGDLANWWIPDGKIMGIGGAMMWPTSVPFAYASSW